MDRKSMRIVPVDTKNGSSKKEAILKFGWSKNYGKALDDPNMKWTIRRFCAVVYWSKESPNTTASQKEQ